MELHQYLTVLVSRNGCQILDLICTSRRNSMSTTLISLSVIFLLICLLSTSVGFDSTKRKNWSILLCGFLGGVFLGLSNSDIKSGIGIGFVVVVISYFVAPYMLSLRNHKE